MGDFLGQALLWLLSLRHPESWVKKTGGFTVIALLAVLAWLFAYEVTDWSRWWQLSVPVTFSLSAS